ncbi:MAG: fumarylacetoacetate hydrolase family protein, partial [Armatimonadota bacterium]
TLDALAPFRVAGDLQEPEVLPHLRRQGMQHFDLVLEVWLRTAEMTKPQKISTSNTKHLYWSLAQQIAHLTSNGCPIEQADLVATGTISGQEKNEAGSLLELTWRGSEPLFMEETGEKRTFLEDGDTLILTGWGQGDGFRVGFGECSGTVRPAI